MPITSSPQAHHAIPATPSRHSRVGGNPEVQRHWIPAYARMTDRGGRGNFAASSADIKNGMDEVG
ncbi:MAG: hypothetical protein PHH87_12105 [Desulfuromonas sp.]|nr:hypothetical protein [Desulfuromonas sp.]